MKNLLLVSLLIYFLISCSKEEKFDVSTFPQKWQLIKTYSNGLGGKGSERTGKDMPWQEYYLLNSDGTSIKHREKDGKSYEALGTFVFKVKDDVIHLEITYKEESSIIGSCYGRLAGYLWIDSENKLIDGWAACDGNGSVYELIK